MPDYHSCLTRFGIEKFRGKQEEAVKDILRGQRPLVIMPTGGGKSLCYQIPALMLFERQQALTVVISPLQALMADQVKDLENQGLNFCTFINGNLSVKERSQRLKQLRSSDTCQLIEELNKNERTPILSPQESVQDWFKACFTDWNRSLEEPTVKTLLKIASDLDLERGYSSENEASNEALPISFGEIVMALLEFNKSDVFLDENAVLFTTCHGAKGLQFRKVILLCDRFKTFAKEIYSERRVFYVAMTRAKEQLILCSTNSNQFIQKTDVSSQTINLDLENLPIIYPNRSSI